MDKGSKFLFAKPGNPKSSKHMYVLFGPWDMQVMSWRRSSVPLICKVISDYILWSRLNMLVLRLQREGGGHDSWCG